MKKLYFFLLTLIVGGIIGWISFYNVTPKSNLAGEGLTPKQIWDAGHNYKREKRERGEAKADKPDDIVFPTLLIFNLSGPGFPGNMIF